MHHRKKSSRKALEPTAARRRRDRVGGFALGSLSCFFFLAVKLRHLLALPGTFELSDLWGLMMVAIGQTAALVLAVYIWGDEPRQNRAPADPAATTAEGLVAPAEAAERRPQTGLDGVLDAAHPSSPERPETPRISRNALGLQDEAEHRTPAGAVK